MLQAIENFIEELCSRATGIAVKNSVDCLYILQPGTAYRHRPRTGNRSDLIAA
jgi:hypothetical protein